MMLYVAAVSFVALRKRDPAGRPEDAIALRVLLTHIQAAGSLRAFKVSGTQLFKEVLSFADVLSPGVVGQGPLECALRPSFAVVFYATLAAPVITAALALVVLLLSTLFNLGPAASKGSTVVHRLRTAVRMRAHTALLLFVLQLAYMPLVSACLGIFDCTPPIDGTRYLTADVRVQCSGRDYILMAFAAGVALAVVGLGFPLLVYWRLRRVTAEKLADPHFAAAWSFLFSGYRQPPPVSRVPVMPQPARALPAADALSRGRRATAALRSRDTPAAALHSDLRLHDTSELEQGFESHVNPLAAAAAAASAAAVAAMPGQSNQSRRPMLEHSLASTKAHGSDDATSHGSASVASTVSPTQSPAIVTGSTDAGGKLRLCEGCLHPRIRRSYTCVRDQPVNMTWFEATVLLRKALTVLLARLVSNALVQIACFELVMVAFIIMHIALRPYAAWRHQFAEGVSLVCIVATAALAILEQPAAGLDAGGTATITAVMLLLNFATVAFLGQQYAQLFLARNSTKVHSAAMLVKRRLSRFSRGSKPQMTGAFAGEGTVTVSQAKMPHLPFQQPTGQLPVAAGGTSHRIVPSGPAGPAAALLKLQASSAADFKATGVGLHEPMSLPGPGAAPALAAAAAASDVPDAQPEAPLRGLARPSVAAARAPGASRRRGSRWQLQ